jgi:hypothetical protein
VHPTPGPFFNTGISVLKNVNTRNTGIIPVLKLKKQIDQIIIGHSVWNSFRIAEISNKKSDALVGRV